MTWWYSEGWRQCSDRVKERLMATLDFFSIDLLVGTLFAPFRQISAGSVRGPLAVQLRAFFDQIISRCIGLFVRLVMIVIGSIVVVLHAVGGLVVLLMWPLVPLLPIVGAVLFATGWMPWNQ